jgi:hypothetical protein
MWHTTYLTIDAKLCDSLVKQVLLLLCPSAVSLCAIGGIEAIVVGVGIGFDQLVRTYACFGPTFHAGLRKRVIEFELLESTTALYRDPCVSACQTSPSPYCCRHRSIALYILTLLFALCSSVGFGAGSTIVTTVTGTCTRIRRSITAAVVVVDVIVVAVAATSTNSARQRITPFVDTVDFDVECFAARYAIASRLNRSSTRREGIISVRTIGSQSISNDRGIGDVCCYQLLSN